ncbi:helix-turn-helix domain-containing protein [Streptomyces sp. NPDC096033]|uniref:helix-turn-helix domain-containing protein n=1 Tax=Streptomyces sp. NPDC096033 TaxID=3366071 RepID=UPI00380E22AE
MTKRTENAARGSLLREERLRRGWTVKEAAERAGVPPMSLYGAESGRRLPTALNRLADLYGLAAEDNATYTPLQVPVRPPSAQGRPRMAVPEALVAEEDEPEVVVDYASEYQARQEQQRRQRERELAYLVGLDQDPERAEKEQKQTPVETPIGFIVPEPPPPPPSPQAVAQARTDTYARLMIPR